MDITKFNKLKRREDIWQILKAEGFKRICEIGVAEGYNASYLAKCDPDELVMVDTWQTSEYYHFWHQEVFDQWHRSVLRLASQHPCMKIMKCDSLDAVKQFDDLHFDFIYVDASHDYTSARANLRAWWPKLRYGGVLAGHDYYCGPWKFHDHVTKTDITIDVGVKTAVDELAFDENAAVAQYGRDNRALSWAVCKQYKVKL